jgi:hypothetical protein
MQPGDRAEAVIHQISELREKFSGGISPQRHDGTKRKRMNGLPDRTALNDLEGCGLSEPWCAGLDKGVNEAAREHRFVLLDFGTVWCHWCHVMEEVTYRDPDVINLIRERYLAVRVNADSRPDLANRYEDYGRFRTRDRRPKRTSQHVDREL